MRMTAAVMYEQGLHAPFVQSRPFHVQEVELDNPGHDELLVEVRGAGLCHSDLTTLEGMRKRPMPIVGGHEGAGIVREVGRNVKGFTVGDHVAMVAVAGCGHCRVCLAGRPGLCIAVSRAKAEGKLGNGARRLKMLDGSLLNHYSGISVYAQYAVVVPQSLVKIDPAMPIELASLLGCAVVTGAGAVLNGAQVKPGSSVAILGLGGVGLSAIMAAREAGAETIIGVDLLASKFDLARACGATHCVCAGDADAVQQVKDLTNGGVDYAFDVVGHIKVLEMANDMAVRGGEVIGVGLGESSATYTMQQLPWVTEERVFRGSFMGSGIPQRDVPKYVDLYLRGRMPIDKLRSSYLSFEELNHGFDLLNSGAVVRQILLPHGPVQSISR